MFVYSFIPSKRSKDGKRFGFVRFINVFNVERLVSNLGTIWVDRSKFHANIARFQRAPLNSNKDQAKKDVGINRRSNNVPGKDGGVNGICKSYVHVLKVNNMSGSKESDSFPSIVLDDECLAFTDLSNPCRGRVKEFASMNLKIALKNEGYVDIYSIYGRIMVLLELSSIKSKELFQENVGVRSWFSVLKQASVDFTPEGRNVWVEIECIPFKTMSMKTFKGFVLKVVGGIIGFIFRGKVFWIHAKEVPGWVPEFLDESDDDDDGSEDGFKDGECKVQDGGSCGDDSDVVEVPDTVFEETLGQQENQSEDPFDIYPFLNNIKDKPESVKASGQSPKYPPGFTPNEENVRSVNDDNPLNCNVEEDQIGQMKTGVNLLMVAVYAPQDRRDKRMLWDYLEHEINQWDGEVVIMGDFNEVRYKSDRFGLVFKVQGADVFNWAFFIAKCQGIEDVL
ncbi:nucleotide-binding alpha-beta plait domain-containing protein [Tanacetum coccineum]